ncbi:MAG: proteasome-activating nucleotidase [Euryarchaeota archaeon]|mgnify:FL=1|nr:proteasome-activating nucleotidase [Euryarchaeota archaeon]
MASDAAGTPHVENDVDSDANLASEIDSLKRDFEMLADRTQTLLTEKLLLENEIAQVSKRAGRLEEDLRHLKTPPLVVGHVQDVIEDRAIVKSSNGTVFLVTYNPRINHEELLPGSRVTLNQDTLSIIEVLNDGWDPLVSASEIIHKPDTKFSMLGGLDQEITSLREAVELPILNPDAFSKFGIDPPRGVLLAGPPGNGKTMLAKALANSTNATFLGIVGSELAQKYIGEGGRLVREIFSMAREKSPSVIFIDEIDAIGSKRLDSTTSGDREVHRTLMQLLAEMDGFSESDGVMVIAATNRMELLDKALLRPGRFDRIIGIDAPDLEGRVSILEIHTKNTPLDDSVDKRKLAKKCEGMSGAELKAVVTEAGMYAISKGKKDMSKEDLEEGVRRVLSERSRSAEGAEALYQ